MIMNATLIFPSSVPDADRYAEAAQQRGERVVAASSLRYDESAEKFKTWFYLPNVHDPDFLRRLNEAITTYGIARVFCPVLVAYVALNRLVAEGRLSLPIIGEIPIDRHLRQHRKLMDDAALRHGFIQGFTGGRSPLSPIEVAAVLRQSMAIFGETDEAKIAAIMAIFADAPSGDIVEIGVLAGRSACVLALMAQRHQTGAVLVVDAWSTAEARQHDTPRDFQAMLDGWAHIVPLESFFESFVVSLLPVAAGTRFNYLALASKNAHRAWSRERKVETPHFGKVDYTGTISVLHIDGNHDYDHVRADCDLWLPHMVPGGWLILDDYVWFHGDGPRRIGDELLVGYRERVQCAFVCGKALFVRLGG
jgi:Methyltransferase domain